MHMFILCVCGGKDINSSCPSQGKSFHKACEKQYFNILRISILKLFVSLQTRVKFLLKMLKLKMRTSNELSINI